MEFAYIAFPARCPSRRAGNPVGNGIFPGKNADAFHSFLRDDVACEHSMVFFEHRGQVFYKFFNPAHQIRMNVCHNPADYIVVLDQSTTTGFFQHIQNFFPVAKSIEKGG